MRDARRSLVVTSTYEAAPALVVALERANADLAEMHREQARRVRELERLRAELQAALDEVRTLRGLLPLCATCHRIQDDAGAWHRLEAYVEARTDATFSHGICATCLEKELATLDEA